MENWRSINHSARIKPDRSVGGRIARNQKKKMRRFKIARGKKKLLANILSMRENFDLIRINWLYHTNI